MKLYDYFTIQPRLATMVDRCDTATSTFFKDNKKMKLRQAGKREVYSKMLAFIIQYDGTEKYDDDDILNMANNRSNLCDAVINAHPRYFGDTCIYLRGKRKAYDDIDMYLQDIPEPPG